MLFNSIVFLIFIALFFLVWPLTKRTVHWRLGYLVVSSFIFYGWWDYRFLALIIASGLINYTVGGAMERHAKYRKLLLLLSILGNMGTLISFKYMAFITENIDQLIGLFGGQGGVREGLPDFMLILPVGISFYTFQSMSYIIDIYRGQIRPTRNILHFFAYLSMFPQLVAGPIVRAKEMLPQLERSITPSREDRWTGMQWIVRGYFKKVVLADTLAPIVAAGFGSVSTEGGALYWWFVVSAFAVQIYCDFSGYSDIARGLAKWMGYDFQVNFNHPYTAVSLQDFWTRWHISLSSWFRDYVYIPLGGSRVSQTRAELNLWVTMLISGFWHGASWNFLMWGATHASFLSLERWSRWPQRLNLLPAGRFLSLFVVLTQVWVGWVFFRAETMADAWTILGNMFGFSSGFETPSGALMSWPSLAGNLTDGFFCIGVLALRELWVFIDPRWPGANGLRRVAESVPFIAILMLATIYFRGTGSDFIYFQF